MGNKSVAVVGMGPVGSILAAHLSRKGCEVTAIDMLRDHIDAIRKNGAVIEGTLQLEAPVSDAFCSVEEAAGAGKRFDAVYLCVKATANGHVVDALANVLADRGAAISFQNGLDTEDALVEKIGPDRSLRGVVNYAGNTLGPGKTRMTFFNPPNYIGAAVPGNAAAEALAREIAELMTGSGLTTRFSDNVKAHVWEKVIRNAALMPVSALTGMDMAEVMGSKTGSRMVEHLLSEAIEIAAKLGFEFDRKFYDDTLSYFRKAGHHVPSMLGDVRDGRKTENEFLNRKITEYGERCGVNAPFNRALADLLTCVDELAATKRR